MNDISPETSTTDDGPQVRLVDFALLLKPRVMSLVVFTAVVGLMLAPGHIDWVPGLIAIACIAVGAGASGAINMWYDRDIDIIMVRTRNRPIPAGRMNPTAALVFGVILSILSVAVMTIWVNFTAGGLLAFTILYYVLLYTMWLKRRTPQNIVIGGAAGAFPPMIGYIAVTGEYGPEAGMLFAIIFLWTPPHTWALTLFSNTDYTEAGVPMLPVVVGEHRTKIQMWFYTLVMVPATLAPVYLQMSGWVYGIAASLLGLNFLRHMWLVWKDTAAARKMFFYSIFYLFGIFAFLLVDRFLFFPVYP